MAVGLAEEFAQAELLQLDFNFSLSLSGVGVCAYLHASVPGQVGFKLCLAQVLQHARDGVEHVAVTDNCLSLCFQDSALRVGLHLCFAWLFRCSEQLFHEQVFAAHLNVGKLDGGKSFGLGQISDAHRLVHKLLDLLQEAQLDDHELFLQIKRHLLPLSRPLKL